MQGWALTAEQTDSQTSQEAAGHVATHGRLPAPPAPGPAPPACSGSTWSSTVAAPAREQNHCCPGKSGGERVACCGCPGPERPSAHLSSLPAAVSQLRPPPQRLDRLVPGYQTPSFSCGSKIPRKASPWTTHQLEGRGGRSRTSPQPCVEHAQDTRTPRRDSDKPISAPSMADHPLRSHCCRVGVPAATSAVSESLTQHWKGS